MKTEIANECRLLPLRFGSIYVCVKREEAFVYYATYIAGEWDFLNIHEGDVVLDAGANIGDFVLKAALRVGVTGLVIAIEPAPENFITLQRNILNNDFKNIICQRKALWDHEAILYLLGGLGGVTLSVGERGTTPVEAITIDALIKELGLNHIDIVKMDIEGAEGNVIKNSTFLGKVREIAVEVHNAESRRIIMEILKDEGFSIKYFTLFDLIRNVIGNLLKHFPDFLNAELKTHFLASKSFVTTFLHPSSCVPACNTRSGLNIIYGRRRIDMDIIYKR